MKNINRCRMCFFPFSSSLCDFSGCGVIFIKVVVVISSPPPKKILSIYTEKIPLLITILFVLY
ncbi:hypothetical protein LguiB_022601 [Lonicera macranthoides]